jgi:hypothetical protein
VEQLFLYGAQAKFLFNLPNCKTEKPQSGAIGALRPFRENITNYWSVSKVQVYCEYPTPVKLQISSLAVV